MDQNNYKEILFSLSIPVIKEMLYKVLVLIDRTDKYPDVEYLCGESVVGSFKVNYKINDIDKVTYIVLKICKGNHDLTQEFNKLQPYLLPEQWKKIQGLLSSLILVVRSLYKDLYTKLELNEEKYSELYVDHCNTTLYLEDIDDRIGIFIDDCTK